MAYGQVIQQEVIDFSTVKPLVESCTLAIKKLKTNPGPAIRSTDSLIPNLQEEHHLLISGVTEQNKTKF